MRRSRPLLLAVVGAQVLYPRVPPERQVAATRGIVGLVLAASVADAVVARGGRRAAVLSGLSAGIGLAAEWAGVATGKPFGPYSYSGKLGPKVAGVPVLAGAAWTMLARPAWVVAGLVERRRVPRALLAAGALTAWDVYLDPRMVREGYWTWPGGGRYEDIPASNFLGWFAVGTAIFGAWAIVDGVDDPRGGDGDDALALYLWTWIGEAVANVLYWERPRVAVVGGTAMGAFALPALRTRLRRG